MTYQTELDFAMQLVRKVGTLISANLTVGHAFDFKKDGSTLTAIDLAINQRVIKALKKKFPADGVLGEEESSLTGNEKRIWVLDPIDGTSPFKSGIPTSCVMLALLVEYQPILGIIYNPHVNQLFFAVRGQGAYLEDRHGRRAIQVNRDFTTLTDTPVGMTGSISGPAFDIPAVRNALGDAGAKPNILGSSGYEMAMVAAGQFGANLFGYPFRHDIAAAAVIVPEAGGKITDAHGQALDFTQPLRGAIISNGSLHQQLVDLVRPHLK